MIAQIDKWVIDRLKETLLSVYFDELPGIINGFLASIFPVRRGFMIIPKIIKRRAAEASGVDEDFAGDVSDGSSGASDESMDLDLRFKVENREFVAAKVIGILDEHHIGVIHLKPHSSSIGESKAQMIKSMTRAAHHASREENLRGYLVMANQVIPFWLESQGSGWEVVQGETFDMFAPGDRFTRELCEIARRNWNNVY